MLLVIQYREFSATAQTPESESPGAQSHVDYQVLQVTLIYFRAVLQPYFLLLPL